jgi:hypothetical protein
VLRRIPRPSAALVVACIALGVALSGTSYADVLSVPFNSVGSGQLKPNAVVSSKVKNGSLLAVDFKSSQLGVRGYEVVTSRSDVTDQIFNSVSMTCPPGKRVVGGGGGTAGVIDPAEGPFIVVSQPFDGGGGWLVQTARRTEGGSVLLGYAICANSS